MAQGQRGLALEQWWTCFLPAYPELYPQNPLAVLDDSQSPIGRIAEGNAGVTADITQQGDVSENIKDLGGLLISGGVHMGRLLEVRMPGQVFLGELDSEGRR